MRAAGLPTVTSSSASDGTTGGYVRTSAMRKTPEKARTFHEDHVGHVERSQMGFEVVGVPCGRAVRGSVTASQRAPAARSIKCGPRVLRGQSLQRRRRSGRIRQRVDRIRVRRFLERCCPRFVLPGYGRCWIVVRGMITIPLRESTGILGNCYFATRTHGNHYDNSTNRKGTNMGRKSAKGTRPLNVEIEESLREQLDARVAEEDRTLRSVVERALRAYLASASGESAPVEVKPVKKKAK